MKVPVHMAHLGPLRVIPGPLLKSDTTSRSARRGDGKAPGIIGTLKKTGLSPVPLTSKCRGTSAENWDCVYGFTCQ